MAFCSQCGVQYTDARQYCSVCGGNVGVLTLSSYSAMLRREGDRLIVQRGTDLPSCCVKCAHPVSGTLRKKNFSWYNPWFNLLFFAGVPGWLILAIVVNSTRKQMTISVPLCEQHREERKKKLWIGALLIIFSPMAMILGGVTNNDVVLGVGGILLTAMLIAGIVFLTMAAPLRAKAIDDRQAVLKGAGEPFFHWIETQQRPNEVVLG